VKRYLAWSRPLLAVGAVVAVLAAATVQPAAAGILYYDEQVLDILDRPASTATGLPVLTASGKPIRVAVVDKRGERVRRAGVRIRLVIVGRRECVRNNVRSTGPRGVARFRVRIDCPGFRLRLRAWHIATPASPHVHVSQFSRAFDVLESTRCGTTCQAEAFRSGTGVQVSAETGDRVLLGLGGTGSDCPDYTETSAAATFDVSGSTTRTTVRFTVPYTGREASTYQVCFSSPESSFTDRAGDPVAKGASGLLRDCHRGYHRDSAGRSAGTSGAGHVPVDADPCVVSRTVKDDKVVVTFSVPPGDPRAKI
jgi:hypothetical protein